MTLSGEVSNGAVVALAYGSAASAVVVILRLIWRENIAPRLTRRAGRILLGYAVLLGGIVLAGELLRLMLGLSL